MFAWLVWSVCISVCLLVAVFVVALYLKCEHHHQKEKGDRQTEDFGSHARCLLGDSVTQAAKPILAGRIHVLSLSLSLRRVLVASDV